MEFKIHSGHILMTIGVIIGMSVLAVSIGDATAKEGVQIVISSIGTFALLLTFKSLFKV